MLPLFVLHFEDIDADGVAHCPGWDLDALKYLFEERGVTAVGHETLVTGGSDHMQAGGGKPASSNRQSPIAISTRSS